MKPFIFIFRNCKLIVDSTANEIVLDGVEQSELTEHGLDIVLEACSDQGIFELRHTLAMSFGNFKWERVKRIKEFFDGNAERQVRELWNSQNG